MVLKVKNAPKPNSTQHYTYKKKKKNMMKISKTAKFMGHRLAERVAETAFVTVTKAEDLAFIVYTLRQT